MKTKLYSDIILLFLLLLAGENANAQSWHWAQSIGEGEYWDNGNSIDVDPTNGDVYTTGSFQGSVDFDPGPGTFNLTSFGYLVYLECFDESCQCYYDCSYYTYLRSIFITKLDGSGNFVWAKAIGGEVLSDANGYSIALDHTGNGDVYTTGYFIGTVDFDPGAGVFNLTSPEHYTYLQCYGENCQCYYDCSYSEYVGSIFISKLDSSGNFVWAKAIGGSEGNSEGTSISLDPAGGGDLHTTGYFFGTVDFDPGPGTHYLSSVGGIFISKLDGSGNFVWAKAMHGPEGNGEGATIALDPTGNGDVYAAGYFFGTVDFDPDTGTYNMTSSGASDIFISRLDSSGNFVWAKAMGGSSADAAYSTVVDPGSGYVYTTGYFQETVDFDPGPGTFNLTSTGVYDIFISKLDGSGNLVWAKSMGGMYDGIAGNSIAVDLAGSGNVYTTGFFSGTVDFDPGPDTFNLTADGANGGSADIFISKLDSSGNFVWAIPAGGTAYEFGRSLALDSSGNVHVTGAFHSPSLSFGNTSLANAGGGDIFVAKLSPCSSIVTSTSDNGSGSLRDICSCSSSGTTITFDSQLIDQTITLTSGEIVINKDLTFSGPGILALTISGNNASRIFHIQQGKNFFLENLSLKNATAVTNGGAALVEGNLTLENVLLQNNSENGSPKSMSLKSTAELTVIGNVKIKN